MGDAYNPEDQQQADNSPPPMTAPPQGSPPAQQSAPPSDPEDQQIAQLRQSLTQKIQQFSPRPAQGGAVKRLLGNFIHGMGQGMMKDAGLPTDDEEVQHATQALNQLDQTQGLIDYHKQTLAALQQQRMITPSAEDAQAMGIPVGQAIPVPIYTALKANASRERIGAGAAQAKVDVANINQGGGLQLPVDQGTATLIGEPGLAGRTLGKTGWQMLNSALSAKGYHVQDMGTNGPDGGLWVIDKGGNKIHQVSPTSLMQARGQAFAQARAENTPFETVEPGTNIPTTISAAQAIHTGAPKVSIAAQAKMGGQYALYNDAYGILDNIDKLSDKVNLDDAGVRARVTAGYAAIKDPAAKGLTGEILSNFLARQPINHQLRPDERELILTMGQGKAAGMGLRSLLGQAGANEMQQRMDAALFPGGQALGSKQSVKQQVEATRGLLGRLSVGQVQSGLNAPDQPGNLASKAGNAPAVEFREGNDVYRIPADKVASFKQKHPQAVLHGR